MDCPDLEDRIADLKHQLTKLHSEYYSLMDQNAEFDEVKKVQQKIRAIEDEIRDLGLM